MQDKTVERSEGEPECGFYRRRFVAHGPWVPVNIYMEFELDSEGFLTTPEVPMARVWTLPKAEPAEWHWPYCEPISIYQYEDLIKMHETDARMAATHAPIDLSENPVGLK